MHPSTSLLIPLLVSALALAPAAQLSSGSAAVPGTANLWGAGHAVPPGPGGGGGGELPAEIALPPGTGRELRFTSVQGQIGFGQGIPLNGADGVAFPPCENVSLDGIAGNVAAQARFLAGVFLDDQEPVDPAPPQLDFTLIGIDFLELAPGLRQTFFTGDGLAQGAGDAVQCFDVPDGATRLFLGFFDSCCCSGPPGAYSDNTGQLAVEYEVCVPQAASETPRLGSPPNPGGSLLPGQTSGPVLGQVWDPAIQPQFLSGLFPNATPVVDLLLLGPPANLPFPSLGGTVLVDPFAPPLTLTTTPGSAFAVPVPDSCSLLGQLIATQGAAVGLDLGQVVVRLTNALDVVPGTF